MIDNTSAPIADTNVTLVLASSSDECTSPQDALLLISDAREFRVGFTVLAEYVSCALNNAATWTWMVLGFIARVSWPLW